jgi:sarcosine oxidase
MATKVFDAAVLGLGTMGTFACLEFARRKFSVLGLDQFAPPHDRGSHTGETRVFRIAYAEHPDYVPLARRAGMLWDQLGKEAQTTFLHRTGMLSLGPPDGALISGTRASSATHGLNVQELSPAEVSSRFPAFDVPPGWQGIFEAEAGWVDVDAAIRFGLNEASRLGADVRVDTRVEHWEPRAGEFAIRTSAGTYLAKRLIVTAGAWSGQLLADLQLPLNVIRKVLIWVNPFRPESFRPDRFPIFASASKFFYGLPDVDGKGVKLSIHWSEGEPATGINVRQPEATREEIAPILEEAASLLPSLAGPLPHAFDRVLRSKTCLYTMTPDEHFVIDRHPGYENLILAAGFSGHGFKFAPAIGEVLADLAFQNEPKIPVDFLGMRRFAPDNL